FPIVRTDTLENDSVVTAEYVAYGPNNLYLRMFEEKLTQLYMLSEERLEPEWLRFIFSVPMENDFEIELLDSVKHENWYIKEQSVGKDTINIWIKDTIVYKRDSLKFAFSYLRSDTNNMYTTYHDTSRFVFKSKTKLSQSKKKKKDDEEGVKDVSRKIAIVTNQSSTQDINKGIAFVFDRPIIGDSIRNIRLEEKVDTLYYERKFDIKQDSIYLRTYRMSYKWKPEAEYRLTIDSAAIRDMYGSVNTEFVRNFKINSTEDYGKLMLHLSGVSGQVIVQLYPSGNKVELGNKEMKITYERVIDQDGAIEFDYITPGKYRIRIIQDDNRNGKWDTGLYLKNKQPEQIYYLPQEFEIRKNFDIEQEFDLKQGDVGVSERKIEK
ncbi:DUF2141 domain-containing protein, partial [Odoribacter sp. OttesenSCG-928-J03]|nr:DUF2141 domain-containing protein [Odoribacter sp. OttesenSCG-928-J03]